MEVIKINQNINTDLVEMLEELLNRAKTGDLQTLASTGLLRDGGVITISSHGDFTDSFRLLGAVTALQHIIMSQIESN